MFLFFNIILFSKKIILLSSPLQVLNYKELIFSNKDLRIKLRNVLILVFSDNKKDKRSDKINNLLKALSIKNTTIVIKQKFFFTICYILVQIRNKLFFIYNLIIIGNLFSNINKEFINISKKVIILDDGTNILDKKSFIEKKRQKYNFFSIFEKKYFKHNYYKKNNLLFQKKNLGKKIKKTNDVFLLGTSAVSQGYLTESDYIKFIYKIVQSLKLKKIFYIPHPKEDTKVFKKKIFVTLVNTDYPAEIFFLKNKELPKMILSFGSSALITLRAISKKFKLINIKYKTKKNIFSNKNYKYIEREKEINKYIKVLGIKSKNVKI